MQQNINVGQVKPDVKKELSGLQDAPLPSSRKVGMRDIRGAIRNFAAPIPRIETLRGDEARVSGFTLIELLVVVLIIGILAAVAVPQYQKAVEKSRATQAITMLKTVYDAAKNYQLATGEWPENFDELSVDIPWTKHTSLIPIGFNRTPLSSDDWAIHIYKANSNDNTGLTLMRLRGKYAGAFFVMYATNTYTSMPTDQLLCGEESTVFNQTAGDYCVKIFQGKQVPNISSGTQYYSVF